MPLGYFFSLASAFSFACYIVVGKITEDGLEPITLVFYLSLLAFVISFPLFWMDKSKLNTHIFKQEFFNPMLWLHVGSIFFAMWTLWQGISVLNPATATMIGRTETLWTVALACLIYKERFSFIYFIAFALALGGICFMQGDLGNAISLSTFSSNGVVYILLSSLFFALAEVFAKNLSQEIPPIRFSIYRHGIIAVAAGVCSVLLGHMHWLDTSQWLNLSLAAFLGPGLARLLYLYSLQRVDLVKTTLLGEIEPVFTALVSFLILREVPSFEEWTGGAMMLGACLILILHVHFDEQKKPATLIEKSIHNVSTISTSTSQAFKANVEPAIY